MKKTYQPKLHEVKRQWHIVDAKGQVLGRLASKIAKLLMGKHKTTYSTHMDMGDYVVVTNSKEVDITGRKSKQKVYYKHSGFPGGFKEISYEKWLTDSPNKIIEHAVNGMLPKNRLQKPRMRRMKVYEDAKHPYEDKLKSSKTKTTVEKKETKDTSKPKLKK